MLLQPIKLHDRESGSVEIENTENERLKSVIRTLSSHLGLSPPIVDLLIQGEISESEIPNLFSTGLNMTSLQEPPRRKLNAQSRRETGGDDGSNSLHDHPTRPVDPRLDLDLIELSDSPSVNRSSRISANEELNESDRPGKDVQETKRFSLSSNRVQYSFDPRTNSYVTFFMTDREKDTSLH
jgi:hypothetical protein